MRSQPEKEHLNHQRVIHCTNHSLIVIVIITQVSTNKGVRWVSIDEVRHCNRPTNDIPQYCHRSFNKPNWLKERLRESEMFTLQACVSICDFKNTNNTTQRFVFKSMYNWMSVDQLIPIDRGTFSCISFGYLNFVSCNVRH